ncbi:hypothetical protein GQ457_03G013950 [Hibiscus cannabinus]
MIPCVRMMVVYRSWTFGFDSGIPRVTISGRSCDWTGLRGLQLLNYTTLSHVYYLTTLSKSFPKVNTALWKSYTRKSELNFNGTALMRK